MVEDLSSYPWSSYPSYVNNAQAPDWLEREAVYALLGAKHRYAAYRDYVAQGVDAQTKQFYARGNYPSVIAEPDYRSWLYEEKLPEIEQMKKVATLLPTTYSMAQLVGRVAAAYGESEAMLRTVKRGRQGSRESRKVAMYLCQQLLGCRLEAIGVYFGLQGKGGVSFSLHQMRAAMQQDVALAQRVGLLASQLLE